MQTNKEGKVNQFFLGAVPIPHRCSATDVLPPLTSSSTTDVQQQMFCLPTLPHPPQMFSNRVSKKFLVQRKKGGEKKN